jgi:hypothetical protein
MSQPSGESLGVPGGGWVDPAVPAAQGEFTASPVPPPSAEGTGMLRFASLVLGLTGVWHAAAGLVALSDPAYYRTTSSALALHVSYTTWGWTHLLIGAVALSCSYGVLVGNRLATAIAIVLAVISAVVNLVFLKAEPFWAVLIIALDVVIIWGVTAQAPRRQAR